MTRYNAYDKFAFIYNEQWSDFAERILPTLDDLVLRQIPVGERILDLCCGAGQLAQLLTERGYRVTGVDGSEGMLRYARENAPNSEFILADARDFNAGTGFAVAFSTFDSLNHIMHLDELTTVFHNVYAALAPGGVFVFDLNMKDGFTTRWLGSYGMVEDDYAFVVRTRYDEVERLGTFDIAMFFRQEDRENVWLRTDLLFTQRDYSEDEIRSALKSAGFTGVEAHYPNGPGRAFFKAIRE